MCRNIRRLYNLNPPVTEDEVREASLQFVRKVTGYRQPSQANEVAFECAVDDVAQVIQKLMDTLVTTAPPHDREAEAVKARARAAKRYAS